MKAILERFFKEYNANLSISLRILGTTDLHTNIVNYDYYKDKESNSLGFAKTATLIKAAREENRNTVLLDNGDLIQGTPLGSFKNSVEPLKEGEIHPAIAALNLFSYDAAAFDFVNTNIVDEATSKNKYTPYVILDKVVKDSHGKETTIKVGVTGIVPPYIL
jgi:2',3'-cyclic-nucleotide 2'-phosphodiesterase (5'-nucleotidase family)